jgi:hypothetical protein
MTQETRVTEYKGAEEAAPLMVTPQYIENTRRSLGLLRQMVQDVLIRDRDYGRVPGIPGDFLWDPGASQIIGAFNCHAGQRRILSLVDDGRKISIILEVPIIHNLSSQEFGSGIGAASTMETKHKYRWIDNPKEWGFDDEATKSMKTRTQDGKTLYRILNPEHDELLNTLVKIASKRGEVDGAEGLPGVSAALRELFSGKRPKQAEKEAPEEDSPRWTSFWSQAKALLGDEAEQRGIEVSDIVHELLSIRSMKDWLKSGKSLDDAIRKLSDKRASRGKTRSEWDKVTKDDVPDYDHLEALIEKLAGIMPTKLYKELGGKNRGDMTIPAWEAFLNLKEIYAPPEG